MEFKGTKEELKVIEDFDYFRIDAKIQGGLIKRVAVSHKSGFSLNESKANAVIMSKSFQLLEALKHTLEILDRVEGNENLIETISNAHANYFNLIQEATTI